ncbi:MAG TPA: AMP-binding protein [Hyphomonadaceae bacterium]
MSAPSSPSLDRIALHARSQPDATACIDLASGERLSYRDFDARVSASASALSHRLGAATGQRVAVLSRNSSNLAVVSAAAERCGAVFVPLNWRLSAPELADILTDCSPSIVLVQPEFADLGREALSTSQAKAPLALLSEATPSDAAATSSFAPAGQHDPCIILYTSGTTGRAKGVVITRENALYSSLNFAAVAAVNAQSVLLCDSPMFHTVGLVAITRTALHEGACVAISDRFVPATTLERLSDPELGVTHYFVVPQMVEALMRDPGIERANFSRLTALFSGGGPLSPQLVRSCLDRGVLLINGYGMSEIGSGIHMPIDASFVSANPQTVGFPAPHLDVMLAGEDGVPVAPGEVGEIWMRGPSVSPGYWNQPEATALSRSGNWFRSGDLARRREDGVYVIVDRLKDMYISGGENVYPAEVEALLRLCPGVEDAAVIGVADERWGETGCAFIQYKAGGASSELAEAEIRRFLSSRLARYKQPSHILIVEAIPRTGSGKARKNILREIYRQRVRAV